MIALPRAAPRLDHPVFVSALVLVAPTLGLLAAALAIGIPGAWPWVLGLDLWLLSFPHVAATFTRTALRRDDARAHRWILVALPLLSLALSAGLVRSGGLRALNTVYFFAQTVHYARQSRGVHRALRHAAGRAPGDPLADAVMYLVALWTLVHRCASGPTLFFGAPLWVPAIPRAVELAALVAALVALGAWVLRVVREAGREDSGRDAFQHAHVLGHVAVFVVSYVVLADATRAWIAVNLWHNAQYLLFVRAWNHRRFTAPGAPDGLLASLSRPVESAPFFAVCALLGAVAYGALFLSAGMIAPGASTVTLYLVLTQAVNFHHYVADTVLWRAPRRG